MRRRLASLVLPLLLFGTAVFLGLAVTEEARLLNGAAAIESAGLVQSRGSGPGTAEYEVSSVEWTPPPLRDFHAALERPIFAPGRRQPSAPVAIEAAAELPAAEVPALELRGIVFAGDLAVALVLVDHGTVLQRVRRGDDVAGWRVEEIDAEGVLLRRRDRSWRLSLDYPARQP